MTHTTIQPKDWAGNAYAYVLAWGMPIAAIIAGAFLAPGVRTVLWTAALAWMGLACLLNARRCGRTHCRYTGPFYLVLIMPVLALGSGLPAASPYAWWILGIAILAGGKLIWWGTERVWGRYR